MKEFGVSRHTVRLAIGDLVTKGWLYREQGSGTFCADRSKLNNNQYLQYPEKYCNRHNLSFRLYISFDY